MIGLDTNILVRYFAQDDKQQSEIATDILENTLSENKPGFISSLVLVETIWTLKRIYKLSTDNLNSILEKLLTTTELSLEYRDEAWKALQLGRSQNIDFVDALIGLIHKSHGCDITLTFDKKASTLEFFKEAE